MATYNTPVYNAQKTNRANTSRLADANVSSGTLEFGQVSYTLTGNEAANDIINLDILPAEVIPIPQLSSITCSGDPGTTLTMHIGTAADADGWAAGMVLSAGGQVAAMSAGNPAWGVHTPLVADAGSGNVVVTATVASANTLTAGTILHFNLVYKRSR